MNDKYIEIIFNQIYPIGSVFLTTKDKLPELFYEIGSWKFIGVTEARYSEVINRGVIPMNTTINCYKRIT